MLYFQQKFFAEWQPNSSDDEGEGEETSSGEDDDEDVYDEEEDEEDDDYEDLDEPDDAAQSPRGLAKNASPGGGGGVDAGITLRPR